MKQEPRWNISEIALSWHFWKPIFTILSIGASVWSLFYYVPFHTILWTLAGIAFVIFLVVVGLISNNQSNGMQTQLEFISSKSHSPFQTNRHPFTKLHFEQKLKTFA